MKNFIETPTTNRGVENTSKYPVIIDWLTLSGHFTTFQEMIRFLGLENSGLTFEETSPKWFYKYAMTYNNEIILMLCQKDDYTMAAVNISGRGCRTIESFSDFSLFDLICKIVSLDNFKVSRIDIAMDIMDNSFSISSLVSATRKGNFTCRSKFYNIMESSDDGIQGTSLYFGKQNSNCFINIYDKRAERGFKPEEMPNWTRIEVRLRHEDAVGFCERLVSGYDVGRLYCGVINNYLRFVVNSSDTNKSRLKTAPYWQKILLHTEKIKVFDSVGVEYDYSKFEEYLFNTCGSTIITYLKTHTVDEFINELSMRNIKLNKRQQILVDNYINGIDYMFLEKF
ncbi:MAG: replication initiation factor domain-containing protein [Eubacterium sp.]|nr:replication initiation factor domain-containing protein [Eubacterium sp.]